MATVALLAMFGAQLSGFACRSLHHVAESSNEVASAHEHHGQPNESAPQNESEAPQRSPDCLLMITCSAVTPTHVQTIQRAEPVAAAPMRTMATREYRNPPLTTPTPPPKFV
jgi:hypothetical protein